MDKGVWTPGPDRPHSIYRYTDKLYKIVQFYQPRLPSGPKGTPEHHDHKLDQSLSRARRVVLEKALCNPWEWFCTFTIAPDKADRTDLAAWWKKFSQFLRDQRKQFPGLSYLLVPEKHKNGAWHCHGLINGLPDTELKLFCDMDTEGYRLPSGKRLPKHLRESDYYNWEAYQDKFGYCSLGRIQCVEAAAFYVSKYIQKDTAALVSAVGLHTYYVSQGLDSAEKHLDFFGRDPFLEKCLVNDYDFCRTGMTHMRDGLDWTFMYEWSIFEQLEPLDVSKPKDAVVEQIENYCKLDQLRLF